VPRRKSGFSSPHFLVRFWPAVGHREHGIATDAAHTFVRRRAFVLDVRCCCATAKVVVGHCAAPTRQTALLISPGLG
jgi:hypothetical protein